MDSFIEKYLRDNGLEMCTWKKNGQYVVTPHHEKIVHFYSLRILNIISIQKTSHVFLYNQFALLILFEGLNVPAAPNHCLIQLETMCCLLIIVHLILIHFNESQ